MNKHEIDLWMNAVGSFEIAHPHWKWDDLLPFEKTVWFHHVDQEAQSQELRCHSAGSASALLSKMDHLNQPLGSIPGNEFSINVSKR